VLSDRHDHAHDYVGITVLNEMCAYVACALC